MSNVDDPTPPSTFGQILAARGVPPLRKPGWSGAIEPVIGLASAEKAVQSVGTASVGAAALPGGALGVGETDPFAVIATAEGTGVFGEPGALFAAPSITDHLSPSGVGGMGDAAGERSPAQTPSVPGHAEKVFPERAMSATFAPEYSEPANSVRANKELGSSAQWNSVPEELVEKRLLSGEPLPSRRQARETAQSGSRGQGHTANALDWSALVLAVVLPPVGLGVSIGALFADRRRVGWATGVTKTAMVLAGVLTVAAAGGVVLAVQLSEDAAAHQATADSSVEFCSALSASDGLLESDTFGWPAVSTTIPLTLTAMSDYSASWAAIAAVAPEGIKAGAQSIVTAADEIIASVTTARTVNNANNVAVMQSAVSSSGISAWATEYCD